MHKHIPNKPVFSQHVPSLDLCRGLAALVVLLLHMDFLFFGSGDVGYKLFPRGYLCVDFFFLLSGYVIACNYDWKIFEGMSAREFVGIRIARLWPLAVLTCLVGFSLELLRGYLLSGSIGPDTAILSALVLNLALLPAFVGVAVFPFNPAAWSIFFEFVINIFYAILHRFMSLRVVVALSLLGLIGLGASAATANSLDIGWSTSNILYAWPRVLYSFMLGVLMWRLRGALRIHFRAYVLVGSLFMAGILMSVPVDASTSWNGIYDFCVAVFVLPVLLIIAIATRLPPWANSLALFLGGISYSVYLWHTPLMVAYSAMLKRVPGHEFNNFVPWAGFVFVPLLLMTSYVTWRFFERPAQKWLRNRFSILSPKRSIA